MVSKPALSPRLVIIEGNDKGKVIPLQDGTIVIGRSKGDIIVQDARVSRSHVAIHYDAASAKLTFTDLKSLNGTTLNGDTCEAGELRDGDRLQIGNTLFDCQIVKEDSSTLTNDTNTEKKLTEKKAASGKSRPSSKITEENLPLEPQLIPLDDVPGEKESPGFDAASVEATREKSLVLIQRIYLRFSRKNRIYALSALALFMVAIFNFMGGSGSSASKGLDRDMASVRDLESKGRLGEAVAAAEKLKKNNPQSVELLILLGDLYGQQGKAEASMMSYNQAVELDPKNGVVHTRLARVYLIAGLRKEADVEMRTVDRLIVEGPHSRDFFIEIANLYLDFRELNIPPQKMIIVGQALQNKFAPDNAAGFKLEAVGQIMEGSLKEAVRLLEKARGLDKDDQAILQYLVLAKVKLGDTAGASALVDEWTKLFPEATEPMLIVAHWKYENKEYPQALAEIKKILEVSAKSPNEPSLPDALNLMGKTYNALNQAPEAQAAFRRSCELGYQASCDARETTSTPSNNPR